MYRKHVLFASQEGAQSETVSARLRYDCDDDAHHLHDLTSASKYPRFENINRVSDYILLYFISCCQIAL